MELKPANYHCHTPRCMHAFGSEREYVEQAIRSGFGILGFSDHSPWPYKSDFVANMRMHVNRLEEYVTCVKALREEYKESIGIKLALECGGFPEFYPWLEDIREKYGFDYFILGNHYDTNDELGLGYFGACAGKKEMWRYLQTTTAAMQSGHFIYLAHPDLCLNRREHFDADCERICREICACAVATDLPLEYNLLGHRRQEGARKRGVLGYCTPEFWQIAAEYDIRAVIGVDAHNPEEMDCAALFEEAKHYLTDLGICVMGRI